MWKLDYAPKFRYIKFSSAPQSEAISTAIAARGQAETVLIGLLLALDGAMLTLSTAIAARGQAETILISLLLALDGAMLTLSTAIAGRE